MKELELMSGEHGLELEHKSGNWVLLKEYGYSPVQMLVASVAACGAYVFKSVLEKSSIPGIVKDVHISYTTNEESKSHELTSIYIVFDLKIEQSYQSRAQSALRLVNEFCPVIQSLNPSVEIHKSIQFIY